MAMTKIVECVPNFSEGRDLDKIEKIVNPFRGKEGVKLLDYSRDVDHNRVVVTVVGEPQAVKEAMLEAMGVAIEVIDMRNHKGEHPRMGAVDVVPFIPVKNMTMTEAVELSKEFAREASENITFQSSFMKSQQQVLIGKTLQTLERANLKECLKR